jgi:ribosomal protein L12E/L44/L45/RPP1/RPP2
MYTDTIKELMSSPKCRSVEVINNPARQGSNHVEINYNDDDDDDDDEEEEKEEEEEEEDLDVRLM